MVTGRKIIVCIAVLSFGLSMARASAMNVARDTELADPFSGLHWQRLANLERPAAPPRLVLVRDAEPADTRKKERQHPSLCVRPGDRVLLRGTNASLSAFSLEARALENGACGERVRARVVLTGAVVEMRVLDPGTAILSGRAAAWR
jgi:hypothetical protein